MRPTGIFILAFFLALSVSFDPELKAQAPGFARPPDPLFEIHCFYKLDDKYSTSENRSEILNWMQTKEKHLSKGNSTEDIFVQSGGGPNGAEWNPSTDLYVLISFDGKDPEDTLELRVNGLEIYHDRPAGKYTWIRLEQEFWEGALREISQNDLPGMFGAEYLRKVEKGEEIPITDLIYGEILKIEAKLGEQTATGYFHATYGE